MTKTVEPEKTCNYPDCNCPFDKADKCLRGLPEALEGDQ